MGAGGPHGTQDLAQATEIGREALVDRGIEGDLPGAMHDQVQIGGQLRDCRQVALDHIDAGQQILDGRALAQLGECGLGQQPAEPVATALTGTRPDQHQQPGLGKVAQQALEQRLSDETGDAGDQQPLACQPLPQHHLNVSPLFPE